MKNNRSSRDSETREHEMLESYNMGYMSPLTLPPGVAKEGFDYYWAPKGIKGTENYEVERLAAKGWTLVPVSRAPNYSFDPLKRNPLSTEYICYKDVILMERPERFSKQETAAFNALNANKLKSLRGVSDDLGSFASPIRSINSF
jgi:hypothetical protein